MGHYLTNKSLMLLFHTRLQSSGLMEYSHPTIRISFKARMQWVGCALIYIRNVISYLIKIFPKYFISYVSISYYISGTFITPTR